MKKFLYLGLLLGLVSCKDNNRDYVVDITNEDIKAEIINISADFYNTSMSLDEFNQKYPFYLDPEVPLETYEIQRKDSVDLEIYKEIQDKINLQETQEELTLLFKHIKHYYPKFTSPKVYVFSSIFNKDFKLEPVQYHAQENVIFIALDMFLGADDKLYKKYTKFESYFLQSMNPQNICPKVSYNIAKNLPLMDIKNNQFLNYMVYNGRIMLLQDAFLPTYPDELKIAYTQQQLEWCYLNEKNMWEYLIREDYIFSDDKDLLRRFIYNGPFSKFYIMDEAGNSVDLDSPGGVGKWIGWQIVRQYMDKNPGVSITELMVDTNFKKIFEQAEYQP